jgi:prepilin-type N-terminal cleavage/methylation domain-containing protein
MQSHRAGFTLVELLIVVTIIGLLASLAIPSISGAMKRAQVTQASSMCAQVKTAITAYNTEYGTWPYDKGTPDGSGTTPSLTTLSTTNAYTILIGDPKQTLTGTTYANPRGIVYMEFQARDLDNPKFPTKFVTPWKVGGQSLDYVIAVDGNYDNQIGNLPDTTSTVVGATTTINAGCAVWCTGIPVNGGINTNPQKFVHTW